MVMETYYRKHPRRRTNQSTMSCQEEAEIVSIAAASETPSSGRLRHIPQLPPRLSDHHRTLFLKGPEVKLNGLYEIDHKNLPPRTPVQLRSIRVAMVCEKTEMNIAVRFPSKESLRAFFKYSTRETHPNLDEKFVMGFACAEKVLVKLVSEEIFTEQKMLETFWLVEPAASEYMSKDDNNITVIDRKSSGDSFLSEALKVNGIVRWGVRRQVKYMGRHKEIEDEGGVKDAVKGVEGSHMKAACEDKEENNVGGGDDDDDDDDDGDGDGDEEDEENENEEEEEEDEEEGGGEDTKIKRGSNRNLKRKRYSFRNIVVKKTKIENSEITKTKTNKKKSQTKKRKASIFKDALILRNPKDRWSTERYKMAEENLLSVMKSKGATAATPILRPQLRAEARKKIGDTGLLDHLLKHMAGKVAPSGDERFRRRHNPDGAMEYWLESADLVGIRKAAEVKDPYWVPPPGWKLGDSPTQDPICASGLMSLKEDMSKMERDFIETKVKLEEEVGKLRREVDELSAYKKRMEAEENNQAITIPASSPDIMSQRLGQLATSLEPSNCDLSSALVLPVEKYKEQLKGIHDFVKEIEEKLVKALIASSSITEKAPAAAELTCKSPNKDQLLTAEKEKEKAAKIERMKSGFRICKPEGTFRWPNMVKDNDSIININNSSSTGSNQVMVQVEVPTPTSVHSSTAPPALAPPPPPHQQQQLLVMNPLAKKRAVKVTVSTDYIEDSDYSKSAADLINFNTGAPPTLNHIPLEVSPNASSSPYYGKKENNTCYSSCAVSNNWLALSTLTSASADSAHG